MPDQSSLNSGEAVKPDPRTEFARRRTGMAGFRTQLALDRTTLAWIRTTLGMASFGFGMVGFFRSLRQQSPTAETIHLQDAAIQFGLGLIYLGILGTVLAGASHWFNLRRLRRGQELVLAAWPLSLTMAVLVAVLGLYGLWSVQTR